MRATPSFVGSFLLLFSMASAAAEAPIQVAGDQIAIGEVIADEAADVMGLDGPSHTPLLVIEAPPIGGSGARVVGRIESFDVESEAWIELWTIYPNGTRSVERTLDRDGPDLRLAGTTERRSFELPVALGAGGAKPLRLELNVGMLGRGIVSVSGLRLERDGGAPPALGAGIWTLGDRGGVPDSGLARALAIALVVSVLGALLAWHARVRRVGPGVDRFVVGPHRELARAVRLASPSPSRAR